MTRTDALTILENKPFHIKLKREYNTALLALSNPGKQVRCGKRIGKGQSQTTISWKHEVRDLFFRLGFKEYEFGNNAPREGKQGDFVLVYE